MMHRRVAGVGLAATIALGVASRRIHLGVFLWDKSLGDALYAVMIYFIVAWLRPGLRPQTLGAAAFAISFAIEAFQATGIPRQLPRIFQIVLGVEFAWHDVVCYAVGAAAVATVDSFARRRARRVIVRPSSNRG